MPVMSCYDDSFKTEASEQVKVISSQKKRAYQEQMVRDVILVLF
jgi:hypothetical protein